VVINVHGMVSRAVTNSAKVTSDQLDSDGADDKASVRVHIF